MKHLLIVDDDKLLCGIYRQKFIAEGFTVDVAEDGEAGLAAIKRSRPDVVLLDIMLPKLDGIQVLKQLRAQPETQKLPVVVLSNAYLASSIAAAREAGATEILTKLNRTPKQVVEEVRNILASSHEASAAVPALAPDPDVAFQAELRKSCLETAPSTLRAMQQSLHGSIKSESDSARLTHFLALFQQSHVLAGSAGVAGLHFLSYAAALLEALLRELCEKPDSLGDSTFRTIAQAIDLLLAMVQRNPDASPSDDSQISILAVDDDPISLRAVNYALHKAQLKGVMMDDPSVALKILELNSFDLIFLDLEMPGMNGLELCTRLRALPGHQKTPVVFLTTATNFENRAQSILSGGNDFIGKPFLFMELTLKALTLILHRRLQAATD